jgi:mitochondrial fission protein ELM1
VLFQSPKSWAASADLVWAPAHDALRGANVITTLTPPHRFTAGLLEELRQRVPDDIAELPRPRIAVLLGGPGAGYRYDAAAIAACAVRLVQLARHAGGLMIARSRRTPPPLLAAIAEASADIPRILWEGGEPNPYPQFLAHADAFVITADSVNMAGEAAATGRPIYVFTPEGGRGKFRRFHAALEAHGATRPLPERLDALENWSYEPLRSAEAVAAEIEARWRSFQSTSAPG